MANNIANAVIELMVSLKGASEAGDQVTALFSSIKTGADNAKTAFTDLNNEMKTGAFKEFASDVKALNKAKLKFKTDNSDLKTTEKQMTKLEKLAQQDRDRKFPKQAAIREEIKLHNKLIDAAKARGKVDKLTGKQLEENLKPLREAKRLAVKKIKDTPSAEFNPEFKKLKAQEESRLNRLDPDRKERKEIEARTRARLAEVDAANKLKEIEKKSKITGTQKAKEKADIRKQGELDLRDIKDRKLSQEQLLKLNNQPGNQSKSEIKAIQTQKKEVKKLADFRKKEQEKRIARAEKHWEDEVRAAAKVANARKEKRDKDFNESAGRGRNAAIPQIVAEEKARRQLQKTIKDVRNARKKGIITEKQEEAQLRELNRQLKNNKGLRGVISRNIGEASSKMRQYGSQLRSVGQDISSLGRQLIFATIAMAGSFIPVITSAAKFQQSVVDTVSVIEGLTIDNFSTRLNLLGNDFLRLGEKSEFTATQIASGAKQLALAGFNTSEIQDALEAVTNLATVGDISTEESARIAANLTRAFKLDASQFESVSDTLTAIATNSNVTIQSIAESFKLLSPIASSLGQDITQVSAAVGLLGTAGLRGSRAGTGLARSFSELLEKSEKFDAKLQSIGSSFAAIDPRNVNFSDIIKEFERLQQLGKLDTSDFFELFDERSARVIVTTLNQGSDALEELIQKAEDSGPRLAQSIKEIKLDTLFGDFLVLKSSLDTLFAEIGTALEPAFRELVQGITEIVKETSVWVAENKEYVEASVEVISKILATVAVLGALTLAIGSVTSAIGVLSSSLSLLGTGLFKLNDIVGKASLAISSFRISAISLTGVLALLKGGLVAARIAFMSFMASLGVFGIALGAISLLIIGIKSLYDSWIEATEKYNAEVKDKAAEEALERMASLLKKSSDNAVEAAKSVSKLKESINLLTRTSELKPLESRKLFSADKLAGTSLTARDTIETLKSDTASEKKKILADRRKQREELRNATSQFDKDRIKKSAKIQGEAFVEYRKNNRERIAEIETLIDREEKLRGVLVEPIQRTFDEIDLGEDRVVAAQLEVTRAEANKNTEEGKVILQNAKDELATEEALLAARKDRINLTEKERKLKENAQNAQNIFGAAKLLGSDQATLEGLASNISDANDELDEYKNDQQAVKDNASEILSLTQDLKELEISLGVDSKSFTKGIEDLEKMKALLFELDENGDILKEQGKFLDGPAIISAKEDLDKARTSLRNLNEDIKDNQDILNDPKATKAAKAIAQQNIDDVTKKTGAGGFTEKERLEKGEAAKENALIKVQGQRSNFKSRTDEFLNNSKTFLTNQTKLASIEEQISLAKEQGNESDITRLEIEKRKLESKNKELKTLAKLNKAVLDAAGTKTTADDTIAKDALASFKANSKLRDKDVKEFEKNRKEKLKSQRTDMIENSELELAEAQKNSSKIRQIKERQGKREIDAEVKKLEATGATQKEIDSFRKQQEELLQNELSEVGRDNKTAQKAAERALSTEDKILSALQSQAKTKRDLLQIDKIRAKFEEQREAFARKKAGRAIRTNEALIKAQEKLKLNPNDLKQQKRVNQLQNRLGQDTDFSNKATEAAGTGPVNLRTATQADTLEAELRAMAAEIKKAFPTPTPPPAGAKSPVNNSTTPPAASGPKTKQQSSSQIPASTSGSNGVKIQNLNMEVSIEGVLADTDELLAEFEAKAPDILLKALNPFA